MKSNFSFSIAALRRHAVSVLCVVTCHGALLMPAKAQEIFEADDALPDIEIVGQEQAERAARQKTTSKTKTRLTGTEGKPSQNSGAGSSGAVAGAAGADVQNSPTGDLPELTVSTSDVAVSGGGSITGASTTVISRQHLERAPQASLADIIAREAGVQSQSLYGGVNGARTSVDIRGFGASGSSNTLILINGRRLNDWDLQGFNLSTISKESIERIEITRGNSGAVLYGDGAVGGVINIITRGGADVTNQMRVEGGIGSFNTREGNVFLSGSSGPFSATLSGTKIRTDGYRDNNDLEQVSGAGDFRWTFAKGSVFFNFAADDQKLGLPGNRIVQAGVVNELRDDRRGTSTPFDYADQQGLRGALGLTYKITPGFEIIVDGGIRNKKQQAGFFSPFQETYVDTDLTIKSFTPRVDVTEPLFGLPSRIIAGIDLYDTDYESRRSQFEGLAPSHIYIGSQESFAAYAQQTLSVSRTTDVSVGGRVQRIETKARDLYDPTAPTNLFFDFQGIPLDQSETNYAWHVGAEQEVGSGLTLLARAAKSFRVPTIDERIGSSRFDVPTNFNLRTQTSHDWEAGARFASGPFNIQSTYFDMRLTDELHFNPRADANLFGFIGFNVNLDPTRRRGVETLASWQVMNNVRLGGNLTYTDARFRDGQYAGNRVPLVAAWTGSLTLSWAVIKKWLTLDAVLNYVGKRHMDDDQINDGPYIPSYTTLDLRIGGEYQQFFWSAAVNNVFDKEYYDYAIESGFTPGRFGFYPQPGRTFMVKAGAKW